MPLHPEGTRRQAIFLFLAIQNGKNGGARKAATVVRKPEFHPQSNSNSLPQAGALQCVLIFDLFSLGSICDRITTQVPHFGQVMHEHTMRSAIPRLYGPFVFTRQRGRTEDRLGAKRASNEPALIPR